MANARSKMRRGGTKGGGELATDPGNKRVPGFLGRSKVKTVDARKGYTEGENKFGPAGRGRKIKMPTGMS